MKVIEGGVTAAKGYKAAGLRAGIKAGKTNKDMAMIYSEKEAVCAGTFTKNVVKAAPVFWDKDVVYKEGKAQAVVVNSGIANACTGEEGLSNCKKEAEKAGELLSIAPEHVLVASTGVIGAQLVMDVVEKGIEMLVPELDSGKEAGENAATAIMTTDTHKKEIAVECTLGGKTVTIGGMCKGAGMIHPNMGTMLSFITSDAAIDQKLLQQFLSEIVEDTFNMISVDGDTSTNDTCLVLCNGLAENPVITEEDEDGKEFKAALAYVMEYLAKQIAAAHKEGEQLGLTADELAFYDALTKPQAIKDFYENEELIAITKELADTLRKNRTIDWQKRDSARARMRMMIKRLLKKHRYPPEGMDDAVQTVMTQCELWTDNNDMELAQKGTDIYTYSQKPDFGKVAEESVPYGN